MTMRAQRPLGRNGAGVFPVGIGTMSFTPFYGPVTEDDAFEILDAAVELGVNHLDSANVYGMGLAEEIIGAYLKRQGRQAEDFFRIASKAGFTRSNPDRPINNDAGHLEAELDASLKRLGLDCIDLFYIHRREQAIPIEEVTASLEQLIAKGKIKSFGFSEIAPASLRRAQAVHPVAAVQSEYSLSCRAPELGMVQATRELGVAMVAFSPVGRSLLTDTPLTHDRARELSFTKDNPRFTEENLTANHTAAAPFRALAAEMGMPAARLAIAWLLHRDDHVIPIPGTRSVAHFRDMVAAVDVNLSEADMAAIETALPPGWAHGDRYNANQWLAVERYF